MVDGDNEDSGEDFMPNKFIKLPSLKVNEFGKNISTSTAVSDAGNSKDDNDIISDDDEDIIRSRHKKPRQIDYTDDDEDDHEVADLTDSMARCQSPSASSSSSNIMSPSESSITTSISDDETIKDSDNDSDIIYDDECSIDPRKITPRQINNTDGDNNFADLIDPMARCQSPSSSSSNIKSSSKR
ncbi:clumping factor B-like isoform X2 [Aphidius gifuensis]|uniref:clumping factor B-like isoform X2 n=1 Tax=Aphidius gifuensis TaxID=684658 RepID=UPI001CDD2204|nr:clumping factor B-like isoform X2 [Aphidius gifuensis]